MPQGELSPFAHHSHTCPQILLRPGRGTHTKNTSCCFKIQPWWLQSINQVDGAGFVLGFIFSYTYGTASSIMKFWVCKKTAASVACSVHAGCLRGLLQAHYSFCSHTQKFAEQGCWPRDALVVWNLQKRKEERKVLNRGLQPTAEFNLMSLTWGENSQQLLLPTDPL